MSHSKMLEAQKKALKKIITDKVFLTKEDGYVGGGEWIFDFRNVLMNGKVANLISDIFYTEHKEEYPFQLCSLEVAGVPLVTSLMTKFFYNGHEDINAFFIRKSRKKSGMLRMVEGEVQAEKKIILVDDVINSGASFWRQIVVLEELGYRVEEVWAILRYRDEEYYKRFHNRGITVRSLFTLDDFTNDLDGEIQNFRAQKRYAQEALFTADWTFKSPLPSLEWVVGKSQPTQDADKIYFGSDNQRFWAINKSDGSEAWHFGVGKHQKRKSIFSNPQLYDGKVFFGSYDGNFYALNAATGKNEWINFDADYIGSSPAVAADLKMIFVGMEYGLFKKQGGVVALDARTGKMLWKDEHVAYTHASPLYISEHQQVAIGSNDGRVRLYEAKTGKKLWECTTFGGATYRPGYSGGFGNGDIKEGIAYYKKRDFLIFGSIDGSLYIVDRKTGHIVHHYRCGFAVLGTPYVYNNHVYFTSLDKHIRCINLETLEVVFEKNLDSTRIFGNPVVIRGLLFIGTNAARLHVLDPKTGEHLGVFQTRERITNAVLYDKEADVFYLPTFANEIIKLIPTAALRKQYRD